MIDAHRRVKRSELHDLGSAVALGFHEPKRLSELSRDTTKTVDMDSLPAMLRPVKAKD